MGWRSLAFCAAVLLLRRLTVWLVIYRWVPVLKRRDDALFVGWFGPIGIAALLYAAMAMYPDGGY